MRNPKRSNSARTVLYGIHPIIETLRAGRRRIEEIFTVKAAADEGLPAAEIEARGIPITRTPEAELRSLAGSPHHQGVAAKVGPFPYTDIDLLLSRQSAPTGPLIILDEIQDPGNLGSILRSAECLGARGVILTSERAASVTPAVEKASAGASAHVPVARVVNLARTIDMLKKAGFWIYGADAGGKDVFHSLDLTGDVALVLGSEGKGLRRLVREKCDGLASIPMAGRIESLSVSQTAAILLAEAMRQRPASKGTISRERGS